MGAQIQVDGHHAIVHGVSGLTGAPVRATDLRGGAALLLAALGARGLTVISDPFHLWRGYYRLEERLQELGAQVQRVSPEPEQLISTGG